LFVSKNTGARVETEGEQFGYTWYRCCVEIFTPDVKYENVANKFYRAATKKERTFHTWDFLALVQTLPESLF
jgi:hypothetical protein